MVPVVVPANDGTNRGYPISRTRLPRRRSSHRRRVCRHHVERLQLIGLEHEQSVVRCLHGVHPDLQADAHVAEIALTARGDILRNAYLIAWRAIGSRTDARPLLHAPLR